MRHMLQGYLAHTALAPAASAPSSSPPVFVAVTSEQLLNTAASVLSSVAGTPVAGMLLEPFVLLEPLDAGVLLEPLVGTPVGVGVTHHLQEGLQDPNM